MNKHYSTHQIAEFSKLKGNKTAYYKIRKRCQGKEKMIL